MKEKTPFQESKRIIVTEKETLELYLSVRKRELAWLREQFSIVNNAIDEMLFKIKETENKLRDLR